MLPDSVAVPRHALTCGDAILRDGALHSLPVLACTVALSRRIREMPRSPTPWGLE